MSESKKTTDRQAIKRWAEERKGIPTFVKGTESEDSGVLRIHFPQASDNDKSFDKIDWDQFFETFEEKNLAMLYQEEKENGEKSTFHKFVNR
ncbi:hypothetical protein [Nafulsella turpanensis]|uniref:hypothetical protein n=1 Tax=Nafulsella turpanensis TaxID=1265690 RepID=UPI0003492352|nr:hypothetical protein [Nafulsella turpanensis]